MDIFSVTSKQAETSTSVVKPNTQSQVREVENSYKASKSAKENEQDKKEIAQKLNETVKKLNSDMESLNTDIKFGFNDKIDTMFVDVLEKSTGKLIRKIPSEEAMALSEKMREIVGTIFDKKG